MEALYLFGVYVRLFAESWPRSAIRIQWKDELECRRCLLCIQTIKSSLTIMSEPDSKTFRPGRGPHGRATSTPGWMRAITGSGSFAFLRLLLAAFLFHMILRKPLFLHIRYERCTTRTTHIRRNWTSATRQEKMCRNKKMLHFSD